MPLATSLDVLEPLFDQLPLGLVVLDRDCRVVIYNRAEEQLAARSRDAVLGQDFFREVAPCMDVRELGGFFREQVGRGGLERTVELSFPFPHVDQPRDVKVRLGSLGVGGTPYGYLMVEDTSLIRSVERMREKLQGLLVHDLKNPLQALTANLEVLSEIASVRDTADAMEAIEEAMDSARRLGQMSLNLLDLSRLESATMPLRRTRTSARNLLARVVNDNRTSAKLSSCKLRQEVPEEFYVRLDEDLLRRALDNLTENAIRVSRTVVLGATINDTHAVFSVIDDGPGIPESLREAVFDKFVQVTSSETARGRNRGLGLTFVKLVAREHGGSVTVECPGTGTVFSVSIPVLP